MSYSIMIKIFRNKSNTNRINVSFHSKTSFYEIKNVISSFVGSYLEDSDDGKVWKIDSGDIDELLDKLMVFKNEIIQVDFDIYEAINKFQQSSAHLLSLRNRLDGVDSGIKLQEPYKLIPFQHVGVEFLYQIRYGLIADTVGLGKTLQGFSAAYKMIKEGHADKCFVIVPSSIKKKWKRDIANFLGVESVILEGTPTERQSIYEKWIYNGDMFLITSYDTLRIDWGKYIEDSVVNNFGVIIDEVQYVKNNSAKRSKICRELVQHKNCKFRFGLSATYIDKGLEDLFGVMLIIDDSILGISYVKFCSEYLKINPWGGVTGYRNVDRITDKMKYVSIRRHKEQVKDQLDAELPEVNDNTLWIDLTKEQKKVYNEVCEGIIKEVADKERVGKISMANMFSQLAYLRQVTLSPELVGSKVKSSAKIDTLKEILPDIVEDNKVVIFSFFTGFVDIMERELNDIGIKCIAMHGKRSEGAQKNRQDNIDKFSDSKDINVLITSDILKEGLDIPAASYVINMDILWTPAGMVQRVGRIDRLSQKSKSIYAINIWSNQGIEKEMFDRVYEREEVATKVMDDGYKEERITKLSFNDLKSMLRFI